MKSWHYKKGIKFGKHLLHTISLGLKISGIKPVFLFKKFSGDLFFDVLGLFWSWSYLWIFWSYHIGGKLQRDETIFMGEVDPSRHHVKVLIWQLEEASSNLTRAKLNKTVQKWCREKFIFHAIIPALYPFWWKFYLLS